MHSGLPPWTLAPSLGNGRCPLKPAYPENLQTYLEESEIMAEEKKKTCILCGEAFEGSDDNPIPLDSGDEGEHCDFCKGSKSGPIQLQPPKDQADQ